MADEQQTVGAGTEQEASATTSKDTQATKAEDQEEFDPERAKALISKLRLAEKEGKAAQKKLAEIEAKAAKDEQERLRQQGDYQKLAEAAEAKVKELEPVTTERDRYKGVLETLLAAERKGLPKHITALLDKLDVADQLAWIAENRETIAKPAAPNINATAGQGGKPATDPKVQEAELRRRFRI